MPYWRESGSYIVQPCGHDLHGLTVTMCTPCGFQVVTTMCQMWTPYDFHMKITLFLCGQNMVSMWLIFHHFYIISVANRSQKITNLWKPVTSLIMVRFSIREKVWKALGVLYLPVVSITTDNMNSLAHPVSCWNLMRFD